MAELVEGFVRGLPADGVAKIVKRAEGVPLYAVETVRMLADRGVLEAGGGVYRLVGDLGDLDIPDSLHALIAARLDGLTPQSRVLLQDASVLGKSFTIESLTSVTGVDQETLEPQLHELARREFLLQELNPRSPERGQYAFLQALIREVAYSTLSKVDRRRKHLATAHHFESIGDDELAGVVATHYVEAYRATPEGPEADALAARARDWLQQAAERAISLGSPAQAVVFVEQALAITPGGAERGNVLDLAGEAAFRAGEAEAAVAYLEETISLYRGLGDPTSAARATAKITRPFSVLDHRLESIARMEAALETLGDEGDDQVRGELYSSLASQTNFTGDPQRALMWAERALPLAERLDMSQVVAETIGWKSVALLNVGRHREALMLAIGSLHLMQKVGDSQALSLAYTNLGVLLAEDDPKAALQAFLDSLEAARRAGIRDLEVLGYANTAEAAIDVGQWAEADRALTGLGDVDPATFLGAALQFGRAMLSAFRGDLATANELIDGVAPRLATEMVTERTWHLRARAVVRLMQGQLEAAYDEAMRSVDAEPAGMNAPLAVWAAAQAAMWLRDAGRLDLVVEAAGPLRGRWIDAVRQTIDAARAALAERFGEAAAGFRAAFDTWTELDLPLDLAFCAIDAITVSPESSVPADVVERARETLEGLGARPMLERLTSAEQPAPTR